MQAACHGVNRAGGAGEPRVRAWMLAGRAAVRVSRAPRFAGDRERRYRSGLDPVLSREQLKTVRKIQIRTSHLVTDLVVGQYHSVFKVRGMEFSEVRLYQPGDEIRSID